MKRLILILAGLILALALFNRFGNPQRTLKGSADEISKTNAAISRPAFRHSSRTIHASPDDSTNSVSTTDEENDNPKKLSREQVDAYLLKTKRSPESLLNAFIETGDTNFLAEAVEKFPNNPIVQWTKLNQEISPEERSQWLEKLKVSSPDNALPNYLSALEKFQSGNVKEALAEIDAASQKREVSSFDNERAQGRVEMYLLSGYSADEAEERGMQSVNNFQDLLSVKDIVQHLAGLQKKYQAAGDETSANELASLGIEVGRRYVNNKSSPYARNQVWGYSFENRVLENLDSERSYDFLGETAGERIQEIKRQKDGWMDLIKEHEERYSRLNSIEKSIYWNRFKIYGERNAISWLKDYHAKPK